ncbi:hypothetical protein FKP32DRAFT_586001 [Trametes sanguinea]|nr:hypothetical protein FKP32DRAFT_586001 [Trametes sanguinea]
MASTASTSSSTTSASEFSSHEVLGPPYQYNVIRVKMRRSPKLAYGFILNAAERRRWACWFGKLVDPNFEETMSKLPAEEVEGEMMDLMGVAQNMLPSLIYAEFPNVPRLRNRLLPVRNGGRVSQHFLFVLRDDVSWQTANAPLDPDEVKAIAKRLGVPDQEAAWYRIDLYVHIRLRTVVTSTHGMALFCQERQVRSRARSCIVSRILCKCHVRQRVSLLAHRGRCEGGYIGLQLEWDTMGRCEAV